MELLVELDAQHESKSRQQTGKKKQAGSMHAEMAQDLKEIEEKQAKLHELMESIYQAAIAQLAALPLILPLTLISPLTLTRTRTRT